ncbi:MAG: DUF177 domain-containing protein [Chitinophagaceae bacterium]|nr:DUF177 domain-containing protein [Chitinophagaceae bacterium]
MSHRREYEIAFVGLKQGIHQFEYQINDAFFEDFNEQDFRNCNAHVKLLLEKSSASFMRMKFEMGGTIEVTCDRCNSSLPFQLFEEFTVTVKMVEDPELMNEQEADPDVYYISRGETHLNVKNLIYEFINLSIPMQKTCEYENMDGPYCNKSAKDILNNMQFDENGQKNSLWKGLEQFKNLE